MSIYVDDGRMAVTTWPFAVSYPFFSGTNLMQVDERVTHYKEKDSGVVYSRQKPVALYTELLKLHARDKTLHVIDACSGAGSCALACMQLQFKCLIIEKSTIKLRLIRQRTAH